MPEPLERRNVSPLLLAALALALGLRLAGLGAESFWHDESWTWGLIDGSWARVLERLEASDANPPLYYLLLLPWSWVSTSEAWLRGFSALASVLAVVALHAAARRAAGPRVAGFAALLAATSPTLVWYGQEARCYALLVLLCALALLAWLALLERPSPSRAIGLGASLAAVGLTHYMGALFAIALGAAALVLRRIDGQRILALLVAAVIAAALCLPFHELVHAQLTRVDSGFWLPEPTPARVLYGLGLTIARPLDLPLPWGFLLPAAVWGLALIQVFRARTRLDLALLVLIVIPIALQLVASLRRPVFYPQTFQYVLIPLFVLVARLLASLPVRVGATVAAVLALATLPYHAAAWGTPQKEDWRGLCALLEERLQPGEAVLVDEGFLGVNLAYYAGPRLREATLLRVGSGDLHADGATPEEIDVTLARVSSLWHICRYRAWRDWPARLASDFEATDSFSSRGVDAMRYERR